MTNETQSGEFGVNVWWTCPELLLPVDEAHAALEASGFEPDQDMPVPSRRNQVSRAAYSFQDRRHKSGRRVTEKTKDSAEYVVYGILGQKRKGDEEVGYDQSTTVKFHKESGTVEAEGSLAEEFEQALARYRHAITDQDVRHFLRKVIKMTYGIAKRPSGGIYFVPDRFVGVVEDAQRALDAMDVGARLYVERVVNGEQERAIVWDAVQVDIDAQIEATLRSVERIGKRASAVTSHQAKLNELGELMGIYQNLLGEEARYEELAERLEDAANTVADKMGALKKEQAGREAITATEVVGSTYKRSRIKMDVVAEAAKALDEAGTAMHYAEIAKAMEANGVELRATRTKTKAQWLLIQLSKAATRGNGSAPVKALGRGVYAHA